MYTLNYVGNMMQGVIDTYLIVLIAIYQIVGRNLVLKEKTLIKELHTAIIQLYEMKMIPYLHSCLKEFIQTALERYEQMGYLEIRAYTNSRGTNTIFLQSPRE